MDSSASETPVTWLFIQKIVQDNKKKNFRDPFWHFFLWETNGGFPSQVGQ